MNISSIQNNYSQTFGMGFRLKGNGAKKLAENFNNSCNPVEAEKRFNSLIIEPLKKVKSEVICDGENVFVKSPNNDMYKVLAGNCIQRDKKISYPVKNEKGVKGFFDVEYQKRTDKPNHSVPVHELEEKIIYAAEIAKEMDKISANSEAGGKIANRFKDIFV